MPLRTDFGHAADAAANHGTLVAKRLLDHQRRILPPDGGHDHPIGIRHQRRHFIAAIASAQMDIGRLIDRFGQFRLERIGLKVARAMQGEGDRDLLLGGEAAGGLDRDKRAL